MRKFTSILQLLVLILLLSFGSASFAGKKKSKTTKALPVHCRLMGSPYNLYSANAEELTSLTRWRTKMLLTKRETLPAACLNSCPNPTEEMKVFCNGLANCQSRCTTEKVIQNSNCSNSSECVQMGCSPMPNRADYQQFLKRDDLIRSKILVFFANKVVEEFLAAEINSIPNDSRDLYRASTEFAINYLLANRGSFSYAQYLPQTMRCLNRSENNILEPILQHNSYSTGTACGHAFGLGQVTPETFYSIFGIQAPGILSVQPFKNTCKNGLEEITLANLPRQCSSEHFLPQYYRIELFKKYASLTPQQIHELRTFDVELQVRIMLATIINKIIQRRSWRGAFASYGNASYANYTGNNICVRNNTLPALEQKTSGVLRTEGL